MHVEMDSVDKIEEHLASYGAKLTIWRDEYGGYNAVLREVRGEKLYEYGIDDNEIRSLLELLGSIAWKLQCRDEDEEIDGIEAGWVKMEVPRFQYTEQVMAGYTEGDWASTPGS